MNLDKPAKFAFGKTRYSITSPRFEGEMTFMYDENGLLKWFSNDAVLDESQMSFLHSRFPITDRLLIELAGTSPTMVIKQTTNEITFDEFWDSYDYKVDKADAQKAWGKLTDAQQRKAFENIPSYRYYLMLRPNQNKLYPATYLRGKYDSNYKELAQQLKTA